jgi:hypothetical protein
MWKVRPTHLVPGPVSIALLAKTLSAMIIAGNATYVDQRSPRKKPDFKPNKKGINENRAQYTTLLEMQHLDNFIRSPTK